jgi:hypothetical protein
MPGFESPSKDLHSKLHDPDCQKNKLAESLRIEYINQPRSVGGLIAQHLSIRSWPDIEALSMLGCLRLKL